MNALFVAMRIETGFASEDSGKSIMLLCTKHCYCKKVKAKELDLSVSVFHVVCYIFFLSFLEKSIASVNQKSPILGNTA